MTDWQSLVAALSVLLILTSVLAYRVPPCTETCCAHRRSLENAERLARQRMAAHDAEHKGFGWRSGDPDRYACDDRECPRNPKR